MRHTILQADADDKDPESGRVNQCMRRLQCVHKVLTPVWTRPKGSWPRAEAKPAHFDIMCGRKSPVFGKASQLLTSLQTLVAALQNRTGPKMADALLRVVSTHGSVLKAVASNEGLLLVQLASHVPHFCSWKYATTNPSMETVLQGSFLVRDVNALLAFSWLDLLFCRTAHHVQSQS